jgi:hypothetical protein
LELSCATSLLTDALLLKWGRRLLIIARREKAYAMVSGGCVVVVLGGRMNDGLLLGADVSSMPLKASRHLRRQRKSQT